MRKKILYGLLLVLSAAFIYTQVRAQLEKPDESSVQTMKFEVEDDQIVEKPVPDDLEEREGFTYDVEDTSQDPDTSISDQGEIEQGQEQGQEQ